MQQALGQEFETHRPLLMGIAYRLLGTASDAEDAVQDVFLKWYEHASNDRIENPKAWLTKVCTNRCLDALRSAHHRRMSYVGPWLPEPLQTETVDSAEDTMDAGNTLDYAFMVMLERLTPKERAAYLLREVFDCDYGEVADILEISEVNCRQVVSRARRHVSNGSKRIENAPRVQRTLLAAFRQALQTGDTRRFAALLSRSAELHADGGGKVIAAQEVIHGDATISHFVMHGLYHAWRGLTLEEVQINGGPGLLLRQGTQVMGCITCEINTEGQAARLFIIRNPDKLSRVTFGRGVALAGGEIFS
ncbi:RNA polymerase sigma-70 factor (ECF subfamily) [Rubricella aquisinus]|uniref:RNA polymerase sigma-70 factor (ECF subfamily) n=1 Tax=Rubricella aquisinus TaxID=2028108 RepID=A0A840X0I0_9RHOB|nr:RNA polymerase sigma factor SigJ [Rubricella aquisinus]MBB5515395.1 RNA polymerase sigma-70 factor (ECF subfamily) [Rubricella aquisinus]